MDEHRVIDRAGNALALANDENPTAALGHRWGADPSQAWVQLDAAEGIVTRLHARMASLSAAFARDRRRAEARRTP